MSFAVRSSLSSEPFEIVTKSGKRFYVHGDILTAQSEPLRCVTTGVWKEATEKKIDLSDWDDKTVRQFAEYLYFGDYHVSGQITGEQKGEEGRQGPLNTAQSPVDLEESGIGKVNILLEHAKVYTLAQYKAVEGLKAMTLERLRMALEELDARNLTGVLVTTASTATVTTMANVPELLEYVYSNTDSLSSSNEPMRDLVSTFATKHLEGLMGQFKMGTLLRERGDFAFELMEKVSERLSDEGAKLHEMVRNASFWMAEASVADKRNQQSEASNAQKIKELEYANAKISILEYKLDKGSPKVIRMGGSRLPS